jgi:hypothetical protein
MAGSEQSDAENQKSTPHEAREKRAAHRADLLDRAIQSIEQKLGSSDVKATFGDFIRLLQLQKEMQVEQPREIKVTWIDPSETESVSEE